MTEENIYRSEVDTKDLEKILSLLQEYTQKLKQICEERMEARYRSFQVATFTAIVFVVAISGFFVWFTNSSEFKASGVVLPIATSVIGLTIAAFFVQFTSLNRMRYRHAFDAEHVAATVKRMIKTASQYSEHASTKLSDKFEFDLRLAEAEAALMLYEKVFRDFSKG